MKEKKISDEMIAELFELIASLKNAGEYEDLFRDLCTQKEIEQMAQRVKAAKLLSEGKTYQQVIAETDISSTTLSRVSRSLQYGNGYKRFIKT